MTTEEFQRALSEYLSSLYSEALSQAIKAGLRKKKINCTVKQSKV